MALFLQSWIDRMVMVQSDLVYSIALLVITACVSVAYVIRVLMKGRVHFDRVEKQGGSSLLSKDLMELCYWGLQPIARLLVFFRVHPNVISGGSLVFGALAGICLAFGHFGFGGVFATICALLDALDGRVARLTSRASPGGAVLDSAGDRYTEFFFLSGLIIYYREIPVLQVLSLFALLGSFMVSYSTAKAEALQVQPPRGSMRRPERAFYLIVGAILSPITIPWLEVHREFSIPIGHPMVVALGLVAVVANVSAVERLICIAKAAQLRREKRMQAQDQAIKPVLIKRDGKRHAADLGDEEEEAVHEPAKAR